ncbi:hypothetical protein COT77_00920 [Candidatus Berkelbacteria bacterium CG10_big_fil_rev_8_21_14_0_10_41_12]|uniref:Peptidase M50 domain-containing protein n=1 Tax=Candidatus Berkelbacteria bacterium CG10_big_fil_rev_8_21_14_0_10_41_12 TaxID=1974513 RepID=A0A2M6WXQ5_9BACT|nr:MAG: hypothetical protein COT77_00920 [Candidatus Berkelbacteria bacterium CG10_big_fil_rev_8_21_14_0_10_41_12]
MPALISILCIFFIIINSYFLNKNISRINYTFYLILSFPGIVIHETSHMLGCIITGAKVVDVSFFSVKGGFVKHTRSALGYIGEAIISVMPIIIGLGFIWSLLYLLKSDISQINLRWALILTQVFIFYFLISIFLTLTPSVQDIQSAFLGILVLSVVSLLLLQKFDSQFLATINNNLIIISISMLAANLAVWGLKVFIKK